MPFAVDYLIVGAGFSGLTIAERLATQCGKTSLIVERRSHIGGNCYDRVDEAGVLIHVYGPHYFRTNSPRILEYLSQFTAWHSVDYRIQSFTEGRFWSFPINLQTFEQLLGRGSSTQEMEAWLAQRRIPLISEPKNSEEAILSQVGWELYEKFFRGYTEKQWRRHPADLDPSVCGRIPIRTDRNDRYLNENFQALPREGYTRLFDNMLSASGDKVQVLLNTDYRDILRDVRYGRMVYTGPIDQFFDCCFGPLPYRSLRFERESFGPEALKERLPISGREGFWQPAMQVNYPNEEAFTRIVEIKHATAQPCAATTIVREYPEDYGPGKEPYYPIPAPDAAALYQKYKALADKQPEVSFIGRLAVYRYYNMDQVVGQALAEFERLKTR